MIGRRQTLTRAAVEQAPPFAAHVVTLDALGAAGDGRLRRALQRAEWFAERANTYLFGILLPLRMKTAKYENSYTPTVLQPAYPPAAHNVGQFATLLGEGGLALGLGLVLFDPLDPFLAPTMQVFMWIMTMLFGIVYGALSFNAALSIGKLVGYFVGRMRGTLLPQAPSGDFEPASDGESESGSDAAVAESAPDPGNDTSTLGPKARRALLAFLTWVMLFVVVGILYAQKPRELQINTASVSIEWWTLALPAALLAVCAGLADGFYQAREIAAAYSSLSSRLRRAERRGSRRHALARRFQAAVTSRAFAAGAHWRMIAGQASAIDGGISVADHASSMAPTEQLIEMTELVPFETGLPEPVALKVTSTAARPKKKVTANHHVGGHATSNNGKTPTSGSVK